MISRELLFRLLRSRGKINNFELIKYFESILTNSKLRNVTRKWVSRSAFIEKNFRLFNNVWLARYLGHNFDVIIITEKMLNALTL